MRLIFFRYVVLIGCFVFLVNKSTAQSFSFNCTRDTIVPACPPALCITLKSVIPDLRGLSDSYVINPTSSTPGCFPVYVEPDDPGGTSTNLTVDDTYSSVINLSFPFPFFGTTYNSLIASTNGLVSFDISKANGFAHFAIPSNLPSTSYDRAIIMGPYHDLDPSIGSSPTQRIQYQEVGASPYRRWVFSFFKVPLYSSGGACDALIENTHQIILYESTGIIEVAVFSKEICNAWQSGRAMIGMQDFSRANSIMVPGRRALDPAWGTIRMNESWRFVPASGPSLFKRVELYDMGGALLSTGTTASLGNGQLDVSFPNICAPPGATTSYVVKSVYEKIDDPTVEIFGTDTVRINRAAGLAAAAGSTPASCGSSNGTITVSGVTGGTAPYEYSLDGIIWQSSNVFTGLTAGTYTVQVRDASLLCTTSVPVTITLAGALPASAVPTPTACTGVNNGTIVITSAGGSGPYTFSLDGGVPQPGTIPFTFTGVTPGGHTIVVTDLSNACTSNPIFVNVATGPGVTGTASTVSTSCPTANNGSIIADAMSGTAPFTYQLDGGAFQSGANPYTFTNVPAGVHTIVIRDNLGCILTLNPVVAAGPVLTATATPGATSCSGALNGTITVTPTSGIAPYTFSLDGGAAIAAPAPYTFTNVSATAHTIVVTDGAGCVTNTINVTVAAGPALSTTAGKTDVLCNGGATGTITVAQPGAGTAPYEYSLDGTTWQLSNIFPGLIAGNYTVYFRESNGCQGNLSIDVGEPAALTTTAANVPVVCNAQSNGIITISPAGGVAPYQYSIDGGANWQSSNVFNVAANSYTITIRDANNCITTQAVTVTEPAALTAASANSPASCDGGNDGVITVIANGGNMGYQYSLDGTTFQGSNTFNVAPGGYTVWVRDNLGCTTSFTTTVVLGSNFTLISQTDPTICEGSSMQLALTSNATQYAWTPSAGLSATNIYNPVANPTVTTQYIVTATLGRCSAEDTVIVNVNAAPTPNAGVDGFICYGQTYQLNASGGTQYSWSPSTYLDNTLVANPVSAATKNITYTLSILSDVNGCASLTTDQVFIDVTPPIKVKTFPYDSVGYSGDQFQLLAVPSDSDVINYAWTPTRGLSDPSIANPIVTVGIVGDVVQYRVVTSTIAGCKGEGFVTVRVYKGPDIYVPTAFTPNNDGKNDRFTPFPVGIKSYKYFRVFNRWGQLIFSTTRVHDGWDGRIAGQDQPSGTYIWMIEGVTKDDKIITKKGTVTLIR